MMFIGQGVRHSQDALVSTEPLVRWGLMARLILCVSVSLLFPWFLNRCTLL
jgi:hypothetical protein